MTDPVVRIGAGKLAQSGLLDTKAVQQAADVVAQCKADGIQTLRVVFADQHGVLRGKTILCDHIESIFVSGVSVPSTLLLKDTAQKTVYPVWHGDGDSPISGAGDVLMIPLPETYRPLPHCAGAAWILCDVVHKDTSEISFAPRSVLRRALRRLHDAGMQMQVGLEVEFHVFALSEADFTHAMAGMPGQPPDTRPLAPGYQLLSETTYAQLNPVMEMLRKAISAIDLPLRSMEVEMGPSQFEFTFGPGDPMTQADNMMMLRTLIKEVCAQQGLHATFMCRPKVDNGCASGWHLHQSVQDLAGVPLMMPSNDETLSKVAAQWIAGILEHASASCLLTTPTVNGYKRYQPYQLAPERIVWGRDNRGAMVRALMVPGDPASRLENRVAEAAANPYYYFASQILSGLDGVMRDLSPPAPIEDPYAVGQSHLPTSLGAAIDVFARSEFYRAALGPEVVDYLVRLKSAEWERYLAHVSDWEQAEYFGLY